MKFFEYNNFDVFIISNNLEDSDDYHAACALENTIK